MTSATLPMTHLLTQPPDWLLAGLRSGDLERVGGAILDAASRSAVALIRESGSGDVSLVSFLPLLTQVGKTHPYMLYLSLAMMGFEAFAERANSVEKQLIGMEETLARIDQKIDISFFSNFDTALELAQNAFIMSDEDHQRKSAFRAIERLIEAQRHFERLLDLQIESRSPIADAYIEVLSLAYAAEARCYLKLEEPATARRRLVAGLDAIRPRFKQHVRTLLTSKPAVYLHPTLAETIDLARLTWVMRWMGTAKDENDAFEQVRTDFFHLEATVAAWEKDLPPAILIPQATEESTASGKLDASKKLMSKVVRLRGSGEAAGAIAALPETMDLIERLIEELERLESYALEIDGFVASNMNWQAWESLSYGADQSAEVPFLLVAPGASPVHPATSG